MCFRSKTTVVDTSAQVAENNRQWEALLAQAEARRVEEQRLAQERYDADVARYNETLTRQQTEFQRQRDEDRAQAEAARTQQSAAAAEAEARWQAMLEEQRNASTTQSAADRAYAEEQNQIMRDEARARADEQNRQYTDLVTRQDQERAAKETAAAERASRLQEYNTGRQNLIDAFTSEVNTAYSGFDPTFFQKYIADYQAAAQPGIDRQYNKERDDLVYGFADAGTIDSRAANKKFGELNEVDQGRRSTVAQEAYGSAQDLQDKIDSQRRDALTTAFTTGAVGREDLPDGVTDVNSELSRVSSGLGNVVGDVRKKASTIPTAGGSDLADVFANNAIDTSGPRRAATSYGRFGGTQGVNTSGVGRTAYTVR